MRFSAAGLMMTQPQSPSGLMISVWGALFQCSVPINVHPGDSSKCACGESLLGVCSVLISASLVLLKE